MRALVLTLASLVLAAVGACTKVASVEARTQIMLRISSQDAVLLERFTELRISVALREGNAWKEPASKLFAKEDLNWPVDIPILPRVPADAFKQFQVVVEAFDEQRVLAQARVISGFVPAQRRVLGLALYICPHRAPGFVCAESSCAGPTCEVCQADGACAPVSDVDPNSLTSLDDEPGSDAGSLPDDAAQSGGAARDTPDSSATVDAGHVAFDASVRSDAGDAGKDSAVADAAQIAVDSGAGSASETGAPDASSPAFVPVRFSSSDHEPLGVFLSADRLRVESRGENVGNARSDGVVKPGSGVFYFEAERLIDTVGMFGAGLASGSASLTAPMGESSASLGVYSDGTFASTGSTCTGPSAQFDARQRHYGFIIDYRGNNPRVHMVLESGQGAAEVKRSCNLSLNVPLHVFYSGSRYEVGYQIAINTGSDTTNLPFHFSLDALRAALDAAGEGAAAQLLVPGFGQTRALAQNAMPNLVRPADRSVAAGSNVVLSGSASDAEDGDLTSKIEWTDMTSPHNAPLTGTGASFSFTPGLGRHPVRMSVTDSIGRTRSEIVMVTATGTLPQANPVRLAADELADSSINLSGDGLSADFRAGTPGGLRANQAIFGQYWYFEAHRALNAPASVAVGLVVREGKLSPVDIVDPPWCATLFMTGLTTYNLNSLGNWDVMNSHYGVAVDYRGEHPIVHFIVGGASNALSGVFVRTIVMKDVWTPVHPFVYGAWLSDDVSADVTLNFGATPFMFDPRNILGADRALGLELGWGMHVP